MTRDQILTWLIMPAVATVIVSGGIIWASRRIP
jgi:hypothetical protein